MTRLYLVRHGQTDWNRDNVFRGRSDQPLNMTGKREGIAVAFALEEINIGGIYASPLKRSMETLLELADRRGSDVQPVQDLIDIDFGDWQGRPKDEVALECKDQYRVWMEDPVNMQFPGGESLQVVADRAHRAILELAERHEGQNFVVCTHRVVCKVLVCKLLGMALDHFWQLKIDTGSINIFTRRGDRWILDHLNKDFHLLPLAEERVTDDF